ncbi:MAG: hypothetical protein U0524_00670 [Candidatus Saccharimonadales bacterium]
MNNTNQQAITLSFNQLITAFVVSTLVAASAVAFITNMVINSKVNALTQTNPVSSTAAQQTNNAPDVCVGSATPQTAADGSVVMGGSGFGVGSFKGGLVGNYSFSYSNNQTNISNTTNTSTNTAIDSRYSGNTISMFNGNSLNSGNTTNTSTSTTTNTSVVTNTVTNTYTDNSNSSVNNSGNTSNTSATSNTINDNSNNSVNTVVTGNTVVVPIP